MATINHTNLYFVCSGRVGRKRYSPSTMPQCQEFLHWVKSNVNEMFAHRISLRVKEGRREKNKNKQKFLNKATVSSVRLEDTHYKRQWMPKHVSCMTLRDKLLFDWRPALASWNLHTYYYRGKRIFKRLSYEFEKALSTHNILQTDLKSFSTMKTETMNGVSTDVCRRFRKKRMI